MDASVRESSRRLASHLALEALAAEVVTALRQTGKRSLLLRGATTAHWLYDDCSRLYSDVDLLVDPAAFRDCERILASMGFERSAIERVFREGRPAHASTWTRGSATIDLHRTLVGLGVSAEDAWPVLYANNEPWQLGRAEVKALNVSARSLVLALHMAQHGPGFGHTKEDLERAVERVPKPSWIVAADLARLLQAEASMAAGLLGVPGGQELCEALGLRLQGEAAVEGSTSFHTAQGLLWLIQTKGTRAKARYLRSKLLPPADVMRARDTSAREGRAALIWAYGARLARIAWHTPSAVRGLVRVRRERHSS